MHSTRIVLWSLFWVAFICIVTAGSLGYEAGEIKGFAKGAVYIGGPGGGTVNGGNITVNVPEGPGRIIIACSPVDGSGTVTGGSGGVTGSGEASSGGWRFNTAPTDAPLACCESGVGAGIEVPDTLPDHPTNLGDKP